MAITKRGSCSSDLSVVSELYVCPQCNRKLTVLKKDNQDITCKDCKCAMCLKIDDICSCQKNSKDN